MLSDEYEDKERLKPRLQGRWAKEDSIEWMKYWKDEQQDKVTTSSLYADVSVGPQFAAIEVLVTLVFDPVVNSCKINVNKG